MICALLRDFAVYNTVIKPVKPKDISLLSDFCLPETHGTDYIAGPINQRTPEFDTKHLLFNGTIKNVGPEIKKLSTWVLFREDFLPKQFPLCGD